MNRLCETLPAANTRTLRTAGSLFLISRRSAPVVATQPMAPDTFEPLTPPAAELKAWLRKHGVDLEGENDTKTLRVMCLCRMKRQEREKRRDDPLGSVWGADTALSVSELKVEIGSMRKTCMNDCKRFKKVIFKLDDVADDMIVQRHSGSCRGTVEHGKCKRCGELTDGIACWAMSLVVQDISDKTVKLEVPGFACRLTTWRAEGPYSEYRLSDESWTASARMCALKDGPDDAVRVCGNQRCKIRVQQSVCARRGCCAAYLYIPYFRARPCRCKKYIGEIPKDWDENSFFI